MLQEHDIFVQLCQRRGIVPPADVYEAVKLSSQTGDLNLSCLSIIIPVAEVISQMLISSSTIKSIDLTDCMLSRGLSSIFNALSEGSCVECLNLKGNNVSGALVAELGQMFTHNNTLKRLHIEWNSIGSNPECFAKFCEGLCRNYNITELDLRYNQISLNCAQSLSKVIKFNRSIKSMDLSWNTLGLLGGETILAAMRGNKHITKFNLRGNCIPSDFVDELDEIVCENQQRQMTMPRGNVEECLETVKNLSVHQENGQRDCCTPMEKPVIQDDPLNSDVCDDVEARPRHRKKLRKKKSSSNSNNLPDDSTEETGEGNEKHPEHNLEASEKINELNKILRDRTMTINLLTEEVELKSSAAKEYRALIEGLQSEITRFYEERDKCVNEKDETIANLKRKVEDWQMNYSKLQESYTNSLQNKVKLEGVVAKYEEDFDKRTQEMKKQLAANAKYYEARASKEKLELHRIREEVKERKKRRDVEVNLLKGILRDTTQALEDCQAQLHKSRVEVREVADNYAALKVKFVENENVAFKYERTMEALQKTKDEKDSVEVKLADAQRNVAHLQQQVASLQGELIEPERRYALVKSELDEEKNKNARLKENLADNRIKLREQDALIEKLNSQILSANTQIGEMQSHRAEILRDHERECKQLRETIAQKERETNDFKAMESQRVSQLYAAFGKYFGSSGPTSVL